MSYAIVHYGRVVLTTDTFNIGRINSELRDLEIDKIVYLSEVGNLPIQLGENTKLLNYKEHYPEINKKIETYDGPLYDIRDDVVIANYYVKPLDINISKTFLIEQVTNARYNNEVKILKIKLSDDHEIYVSTSRENRSNIARKALSTSNIRFNYKFESGWANVTLEDLKHVLNKIDEHVQKLYDWEYSKHTEIAACECLTDLNNIEVDYADV